MEDRTLGLLDAIPYLRAYAGQTFVVKAGGELLEQPRWREDVARDLAVLHRLGIRVVLVHGGGPQLDRAAERLGIASQTVAGRRITSPELLETATMVWRGQLSLQWVTALQKAGESAIGLSGADGGVVRARRRPPVSVVDDEGTERVVDYGLVGDVTEVRPGLVRAVLQAGAIPVVSPLAVDEEAAILNVNADTVAAELAVALGAAKLLLLTRAPGILADPDDDTSVLHWTDLEELAGLEATGALRGGMRPKVAAVRRAIEGGVPRVHVVDGRRPRAVLEEVFTTDGSGTLIVAEADEAPAEPLGI